jgi:hypothetical protein
LRISRQAESLSNGNAGRITLEVINFRTTGSMFDCEALHSLHAQLAQGISYLSTYIINFRRKGLHLCGGPLLGTHQAPFKELR